MGRGCLLKYSISPQTIPCDAITLEVNNYNNSSDFLEKWPAASLSVYHRDEQVVLMLSREASKQLASPEENPHTLVVYFEQWKHMTKELNQKLAKSIPSRCLLQRVYTRKICLCKKMGVKEGGWCLLEGGVFSLHLYSDTVFGSSLPIQHRHIELPVTSVKCAFS